MSKYMVAKYDKYLRTVVGRREHHNNFSTAQRVAVEIVNRNSALDDGAVRLEFVGPSAIYYVTASRYAAVVLELEENLKHT